MQPALGERAHLALPRRLNHFESKKHSGAGKHLCRGRINLL
jgi:hypothetical protein